MSIRNKFTALKLEFEPLSLHQRFERVVVLILTLLLVIVVVAAMWNLVLRVFGLVLSGGFDPSEYEAFQAVFGMIFAVIIALEFKKSILVVAARGESIVQIRSVIVIALLAICRKIIILDLSKTDASHILALAVAILALGTVYWLISDRDRRAVRNG